MTVTFRKPVVIDPDKVVEKQLKKSQHYVFRIGVKDKDKEHDTFLVLKSSTLNQFADTLIEQSLAMGNLRVVFVYMDTNADVFFDKVQELDTPDLVRKLFRFNSAEQINRVLRAWCDKRAAGTIAGAYVESDELVVQACDLKHYRIHFKDFPSLADLPKDQRKNFKIDAMGNHIFWPKHDASIDLDVIRYHQNDDFRKAMDMDALAEYKEFLGPAIEALMKKHRLTQATVKAKGGPTERHLYRLASREQELTSNMIDKLAKAHGISSKDYVNELVAACDSVVAKDAEAM